MNIILKPEAQEFIAKYIGDMSKAIFTVGFASYFFEKLPWFMRIAFIILAIVLFILSVILMENKGEKQWKQ